MSGQPKIKVHRGEDGDWRWQWKAGNGRIVGASTEGYRRRAECIRNLEYLTDGRLELTYRFRVLGGLFQQGWLLQDNRRTFVEVMPT